jgi:hypothetical protein
MKKLKLISMKQDKISIKNSSEDENMKHLWFKGSYLGHAYREVDGLGNLGW